MGWGDVKMAAFIGLVTGYPMIFVAILLAVIAGGLVAWLLILVRKKDRKQGIPFELRLPRNGAADPHAKSGRVLISGFREKTSNTPLTIPFASNGTPQ